MADIDIGNCGSSEPFALRVIGYDMSPEFEEGHVIIIDPGGQVVNGCFVVAEIEQSFILRQLIIDGDDYRLRAFKVGVVDRVLSRGLDDLVGVVSQRAGKRREQHKRYD